MCLAPRLHSPAAPERRSRLPTSYTTTFQKTSRRELHRRHERQDRGKRSNRGAPVDRAPAHRHALHAT